MAISGGCHCGAIRYEAADEALTHALCHCTDCRRHAGAPTARRVAGRFAIEDIECGGPLPAAPAAGYAPVISDRPSTFFTARNDLSNNVRNERNAKQQNDQLKNILRYST